MSRLMMLFVAVVFIGLHACHGLTIDAPMHQTLQKGTTDTLKCQATPHLGETVGNTKWKYKHNRVLSEGGRYSFTNEGLTINNVQTTDGGLYVCEVRLATATNHRHGAIYQKFITAEIV